MGLMSIITGCVIIRLAVSVSIFGGGSTNLRPVILVPGKGGNQIQAIVDRRFRYKQDMTGYHCPTYDKPFRLWLDVWQLLPKAQLCFSEIMELDYDRERHTSINKMGVTTLIPGFGTTATVEYVDPSWAAWLLGNSGKYFYPLVKELLSMGYKRDRNLFAAPYDFRLLPHSQPAYFDKLQHLIEDAYYKNGQERVVLLTHSMGGLFSMRFLQSMSQAWKDKYVHAFIPVNTPWDGATIILGMLISGYDYGDTTDTISPVAMRKHQRSYETVFYLMPSNATWPEDDLLVVTQEGNYTVKTLPELFDRLNHTEARYIMEDIRRMGYRNMDFPGVNTYCWFSRLGKNPSTPEVVTYTAGGFPDILPSYVYGDGDGTVNLKSLRHCEIWAADEARRGGNFSSQLFEGPNHIGIFEDGKFIEEFSKIVTVP